MRRLLANLALLAVSLAVAGGLAELAMRLRFGSPGHWRFPQEYYEPDPEIGLHLRPGQRAYTHDEVVETNTQGLRDREHPRERPAGTRRLLALGDSQTFGDGLALEETWPKQLETRLAREEPARRWEVLNAGISGTDTWQHARLLERLSGAYELDGVVLAFYVNDVAVRPQRVTPVAGRTNTTTKRIAYALKRSALAAGVLQARLLLPSERARLGMDREDRIVTGEPDRLLERGWADVRRSLAEMKQRCDALGIGFLVAVLPRRDQVYSERPATAYQERVTRIATDLGIPVLDLLEPLRAAWSEHGSALFIPWDGHDSALANEVIARELAGPVRALAAPPAGSAAGP